MKPKPIPAEMQAEWEVLETLRREISPKSLAATSEGLRRYRDGLSAYRDARRVFNQRWADILSTYRIEFENGDQ